MTYSNGKSLIDNLKEIAEKIFLEAPEYFNNAIALTDKNIINSRFSQITDIEDFAHDTLIDYFKRNPYNVGLTKVIEVSGCKDVLGKRKANLVIFGIKEETDNTADIQNGFFSFFHESMHASKGMPEIKRKDIHENEVFANVGAYLLYLREIGNDDFIKSIIFETAPELLNKNQYNEIGAYYSTSALMAADYISEKIDVKKLSFQQIKTIATSIGEEFSLSRKKREYLFNTLNNRTGGDKFLENILLEKDLETYKIFRQISLSNQFKKAAGKNAKAIEDVLQEKDKQIGVIMNPIEEMRTNGIRSKTESLLKTMKLMG